MVIKDLCHLVLSRIRQTKRFFTLNISNGNSSVPLGDNEGLDFGPNSWGSKKEEYSGAKSLNTMCEEILLSDGEFYWARD